MGNTFYFEWEVALMQWIQSWLGPVGTVIASVFSEMGEQLVCVAVLGFLYWCWEKEYGKYVGLNVLVGITLNPMVKNIFLRRRPYFDHSGIQCLKPVERGADIYDISAQGYSFPSGHSTNGVTLYTSLGRYKKNRVLMIIGIIIPLLVGISRFCVGVHYPTDVICGWALGLIVIFLVPALQRAIKNRWVFYGLLVLIALPGWFYCRSADYYTAFCILLGFIVAVEFEDRFVKFENTRNVLRCILRLVLGVGVYFGLSTLSKLPFSKEFLDSATMASYAVRAVRYFVIIFVTIGIYPLIFKLGDRIFKRKG